MRNHPTKDFSSNTHTHRSKYERKNPNKLTRKRKNRYLYDSNRVERHLNWDFWCDKKNNNQFNDSSFWILSFPFWCIRSPLIVFNFNFRENNDGCRFNFARSFLKKKKKRNYYSFFYSLTKQNNIIKKKALGQTQYYFTLLFITEKI